MLSSALNPLLPTGLVPSTSIGLPTAADGSSQAQTAGLFGQMLGDAVSNVANQQARAEQLVEDHLLGHSVTDIEVLTTIKQADLTLKTMLQVRNRVVEAYKQLEQMQL